MTSDDHDRLLPEQRARVRIDGMLATAGWIVQDYKAVNLYAGTGVAVRELVTNAGPADYVLFVNRQAVGVVEAKKKGTTLSGVEWQTVKYQANLPDALPAYLIDGRVPYGYESTGDETWFTCRMDPEPTARRVFWFHGPETLMWEIEGQIEHAGGTLRARIRAMPDLEHDPARLRDAQFAAITNLERSFTNLASINLGTLKQLPVPAPPRTEQEAVVVELRKTDDARQRLMTSIEQARKRAASLRRSILAAAFAGQLVPQARATSLPRTCSNGSGSSGRQPPQPGALDLGRPGNDADLHPVRMNCPTRAGGRP